MNLLLSNPALNPAEIKNYPCVKNKQGMWATAVYDRWTDEWYVHSFQTVNGAIGNMAHFRDIRFGNMYLYECHWKDKWMLVGVLDNCIPEEILMSHPPKRGGRIKATA